MKGRRSSPVKILAFKREIEIKVITLTLLITVQPLIRAYTVAIVVSYYIKLQDFGQFWPIFVTK